MLRERDHMLTEIKGHLIRAQEMMKNSSDKHRRDLKFEVGAMVFLKLRPYRQNSLAKRFCQKLAARFYGPFEILECIGPAAYRLKLPFDCKIHPVFHVSQLKPVLGKDHVVHPLPTLYSTTDELVLYPDYIITTIYDSEGHLKALVNWKGLPGYEQSWFRVKDLALQFPVSRIQA